uniref:Uncharacterized protein n=1 Tax=Arundo donax TaxID=35708 RepID=A0A0A9GY09_ARUDO
MACWATTNGSKPGRTVSCATSTKPYESSRLTPRNGWNQWHLNNTSLKGFFPWKVSSIISSIIP